jgi:hypothetical protein
MLFILSSYYGLAIAKIAEVRVVACVYDGKETSSRIICGQAISIYHTGIYRHGTWKASG